MARVCAVRLIVNRWDSRLQPANSVRQGIGAATLFILGLAFFAASMSSGPARASTASELPGAPELTELRYEGSYSSVTLQELAADLGYLAPIKLKWIGNTFSGPQDIQACGSGDVDYGAAFNGSIEKLIAAGAPIKAVIGSSGSDGVAFSALYVLDASQFHTAHDLISRKIGSIPWVRQSNSRSIITCIGAV